MDVICKFCGSENVYFSKKKKLYVCEDCEQSFELDAEILPRKVFLSYGHDSNSEIIEIIYKKLKERGHDPWIDKANIKAGDDWRNEITKGILQSNGFLAFISNYSVRIPGVCLDEISIGVSNYNCRIQSVLLEKGVSAPNCISNIQWLDMSNWKEMKEKDEAIWEKWINEKVEKIISIIEDPSNIIISGNITNLEKNLMPLSPSLKMRQILKRELILRDWLTEKVKEYVEDSKSKALIIFGSPGTGKSVLSAYLSNFSMACAAAYFCEFNNSQTLMSDSLINSIAFQLACSMDDYQKMLIDIVNERPVAGMTTDEKLDLLLLQPLNRLIDGNREKRIIVVDAIDEASQNNDQFLNIIERLIEGLPHWIKVIITARPEKQLVSSFQIYDNVLIDKYTKETNEDIWRYVKQGIQDADLADRITKKSRGSFLYARELMKMFIEKGESFSIDMIPSGLAGAYYVNFKRTFSNIDIYETKYRPIFELLFAAKEQLSLNDMALFLNLPEDILKKRLWNINSYINQLNKDGHSIVQIVHKSILEWLTSEGANEYRIITERGNRYFEEYLLDATQKDLEIPEYLAKYSMLHISRRRWEEMDLPLQELVLEKLFITSQKYGLIKREEEYLKALMESVGRTAKYYYYALEHYKKISGERVLEVAQAATDYSDRSTLSEQDSFGLICQIAFAFFYAGYAEKGYQLILNERNKHKKEFWEIDNNDAKYWHVVSVCAHDLDSNEDVVIAAQKDAETCKTRKKYYNRYIAMINLFDGYMAVGQLENAENTANRVFDAIEDRYYVHVDDILNICYANLLQTEGRIMESLVYYEKGIKMAKDIQTWDYLYGSIWRELAIAKFGDHSSLGRLMKYRAMAKDTGYNYLVSLADCFLIVSGYYLDKNDFEGFYDEILEIGMPGHILQASASLMLLNNNLNQISHMIEALGKCNGVKGAPTIILQFYKSFYKLLPTDEAEIIDNWCSKYIKPIYEFEKAVIKKNTSNLNNTPRLKPYNCVNCQAKCCYDGVYITQKEEETINEFVGKYPEYFQNIKRPYIVNGDWPGMRSMRKTEKKPFDGYDASFPDHFTKTRCVFALDTGECILQRTATDLQMHPWKIKPRACWSFPIGGVSGDIINPPETDQLCDSDYVDDSYPGYATFLPCTDESMDEEGIIWFEKYRFEVEYYRYLMNNNKL